MKQIAFFGMCLAALTSFLGSDTLFAASPPPKVVNCDALGKDWPIKRATDAWLDLVDRGDYVQSWVAAAPIVKCFHNAESWSRHLYKNRHCLGQPEVRHLCECTAVYDPSGFPKGQYYWMHFETRFSCGGCVNEIVMLHCECDAAAGERWRVVHYSIQ